MKRGITMRPKSKFGLVLQYILTVMAGIITAFWLVLFGMCVVEFIGYIMDGSDLDDLGMFIMLFGGIGYFVMALFFGIPFIRSVINLCRYHKIKEINNAE